MRVKRCFSKNARAFNSRTWSYRIFADRSIPISTGWPYGRGDGGGRRSAICSRAFGFYESIQKFTRVQVIEESDRWKGKEGEREREREWEKIVAKSCEKLSKTWKSARRWAARIDCSMPFKIMDRLSELALTIPGMIVVGLAGCMELQYRRSFAKAYSSLSYRLIVHDGAALSVVIYCHLLERATARIVSFGFIGPPSKNIPCSIARRRRTTIRLHILNVVCNSSFIYSDRKNIWRKNDL